MLARITRPRACQVCEESHRAWVRTLRGWSTCAQCGAVYCRRCWARLPVTDDPGEWWSVTAIHRRTCLACGAVMEEQIRKRSS